MFEDSLVESAALLGTRNRWPALLSITTQCAIAVLIVSLPLLHPELIPLPSRISVSLAPPRPPAPPPVQLHTRLLSATTSPTMPAAPAIERTTACACHNLSLSGPPVDAPSLGNINLAGNSSLPLGVAAAAPPGPRVTVGVSATKQKSAPTRVSSGVIAGLLIAPIRPEYPQIAKITHTEGTVVVDAIISRTGAIESAHILSGPPMLQAAALEAVRQARYRPFTLNGQPTEVQTTVTIVFRMGS